MAKIRNTMAAGIRIQMLIFSKYAVDANIHHSANAQLSPMKIFAGFILKNMKATNVAIHIPSTVVARYL
jgi:hypothetical protein